MLDNMIFRLYLAVFFTALVLYAVVMLALCIFFPGRCLKAFAAMVFIAHRRLFFGGRFEAQEGVMSWKKEDRAEYFENPN